MTGIRSMTGFATAASTLADGRSFSLTVKSVNHRHLDLSIRLPGALDPLEAALRQAIKQRVRRGHVELTLTIERTERSASLLTLDETLLAAHAAAFTRASALLGITQPMDINGLLRMPGVLAAGAGPATLDEADVLPLLHQVLARFDQARLAEGSALADELRAAMARIAMLAEEATQLRAGVAAAEFARLKLRMAELLAANANEDRLLTEAALLAARGDIEEELVRLRTHVARFLQILDAGGELGRPLDFLLQEMNREANTALSKTGGSAGEAGLRLTEIGLAVKLELERVREQVQNLE